MLSGVPSAPRRPSRCRLGLWKAKRQPLLAHWQPLWAKHTGHLSSCRLNTCMAHPSSSPHEPSVRMIAYTLPGGWQFPGWSDADKDVLSFRVAVAACKRYDAGLQTRTRWAHNHCEAATPRAHDHCPRAHNDCQRLANTPASQQSLRRSQASTHHLVMHFLCRLKRLSPRATSPQWRPRCAVVTNVAGVEGPGAGSPLVSQ